MFSRNRFLWCVVGYCDNTTATTPRKLFIKLPDDPVMRNLWLTLARKKPELFSKYKSFHFCEDHFNLPNDVLNYEELKNIILYGGNVGYNVIMKPRCVPSKFNWKNEKIMEIGVQGAPVIPQLGEEGGHVIPQLGDSEEKAWSPIPGRQQVSRHLKKGVVPSVFTWTDKKIIEPSPVTAASKNAFSMGDSLRESPVEAIEQIREQLNNNEHTDDEHKHDINRKENVNTYETSDELNPYQEENKTKKKTENKHRLNTMKLRDRKKKLMRKCLVPNCNNKLSNDISLHPCPNNSVIRNKWAESLKVSYQYVKNMVACSLHFFSADFIKAKESGEKILKHNAVPTRSIPMPMRPADKIIMEQAVHIEERPENMSSPNEENATKSVKTGGKLQECRTCLRVLGDKKSSCNVYQAWSIPWKGMEATIAEDLAKLAHIEISNTDLFSKIICEPCYKKLLDAAKFAAQVRHSDLLIRQGLTSTIEQPKPRQDERIIDHSLNNPTEVWPKPIQVDKNIDGSILHDPMEVEIKQEILSEDEDNGNQNNYIETELGNMDIKIEPEEFVEAPPMNITINGTISLNPLNSENKQMEDMTNGTTEEYQEEQYLEPEIKEEPQSEEEQEIEQPPDLPLECLLCTKSFHSVTGLKAHVIAQHSYKTVKRKSDGSLSPERKRTDKYHCDICRRSFLTSTDLMVHETCHNKHACYGCTQKFDSFPQLIQHRKKCKASLANSVPKVKTLDDVKRPMSEEKEDFVRIEKVETKAGCDKENMVDTISDQNHTEATQNTLQESNTDSKEVDDQIHELASLITDKNESNEQSNKNRDIDMFDVENKLKELMDSDPIEPIPQSNDLNQELSDNAMELSLRSTLEQD